MKPCIVCIPKYISLDLVLASYHFRWGITLQFKFAGIVFLISLAVAAHVGLSRLVVADRAHPVEAGQPVRVAAVTVEVLRVGAAGALRSLPHLTQVGIDVAGAVACSRQAVARPDEAILLVVAVVLCLAAP